jgi:predicted ester cyclase
MKRATLTAAAAVIAGAGLVLSGCSAGSPGRASTDPASTVSHARGLVRPRTIHIGHSSVTRARPIVLRAQQLYSFWNTGDTKWLDAAVDPSFRDRTLPAGRPQGPTGPAFASAQFRKAVPDLSCSLDDLYVTGDTFTARLTFTGHFTGTSGDTRGTGQRIDFGAIDIQHVGASGQIVEDWHLEDNLTFMQQAGLVPAPTS